MRASTSLFLWQSVTNKKFPTTSDSQFLRFFKESYLNDEALLIFYCRDYKFMFFQLSVKIHENQRHSS